ncbi:MAG: polysaccharide biosynthesis protein [Bacteroidetes bacterium]|nr:polysaccharide biosynthesis protein [Bacteroidota bacterium]
MSTLKKLAGQTAIYGLSSILGRLLNYLLVPVYTLSYTTAEYGIVSEFYAYVAFFTVLLTFGLETTYFRFIYKSENKEKTFNEIFSLVLIISGIFLVLILVFSQGIANLMLFPQYQNFVMWFGCILVFDATSSILLAKLRYQNQARKFALIQLSSIGLNILLNLIFVLYAKRAVDAGNTDGLAAVIYSPAIGIGYIFIANFFSSLLKPLLLYKELSMYKFTVSKTQARTLLVFAAPLAIAGFAGIVNETIDRPMIKYLVYAQSGDLEFAESQVGIYSGNYKLSILITLFIQAFRYAAEPFFFAQEKSEDKAKVYAKIMTWFVIVVTLIFVGVSLNLDIFKWFLPKEAYWVGLKIVPVLLLANVFLGIYYNQSIWYKLADRPMFGAYISIGGAVLTIVLNLALIPLLGYVGSAWATLLVYFGMSLASWYLGQRHYPIRYNMRKILLYLASSVVLVLLGLVIQGDNVMVNVAIGLAFSAVFLGLVFFIERPLSALKKR